jgi:hypothetical protein
LHGKKYAYLPVVLSSDFDAAGDPFTCVYWLAFTIVDADVFLAAITLRTLFEVDFLLSEAALVFAVRGDLGGDAGFVTFPSDARSLIR